MEVWQIGYKVTEAVGESSTSIDTSYHPALLSISSSCQIKVSKFGGKVIWKGDIQRIKKWYVTNKSKTESESESDCFVWEDVDSFRHSCYTLEASRIATYYTYYVDKLVSKRLMTNNDNIHINKIVNKKEVEDRMMIVILLGFLLLFIAVKILFLLLLLLCGIVQIIM